MSRTYRKTRERGSRVWSWLTAKTPTGDSKPYRERHIATDSRGKTWVCRCDRCIDDKLHKHHKKMVDPILWELKQLE